jgi:hypothetical protein
MITLKCKQHTTRATKIKPNWVVSKLRKQALRFATMFASRPKARWQTVRHPAKLFWRTGRRLHFVANPNVWNEVSQWPMPSKDFAAPSERILLPTIDECKGAEKRSAAIKGSRYVYLNVPGTFT